MIKYEKFFLKLLMHKEMHDWYDITINDSTINDIRMFNDMPKLTI